MGVKNIININGDSFEYSLTGNGGPNLIFISGFRIPMSNWEKLLPDAESIGKVFTYNRLGVGKSSKAAMTQTGDVIINSLREILAALNIPPPYVLVAHSIGGIFANFFARLRPEEVSTIVFVDAAHPDEKEQQSKFKPPFALHKINERIKSIERIFDKYKYSEDEHIAKTIQQVSEAGAFPAIPIAVVSGTKKMPFVPEESFNVHLQFQKKLLALSSNSRQYFAKNSGHFPQITEPAVVINAINDMMSDKIHG